MAANPPPQPGQPAGPAPPPPPPPGLPTVDVMINELNKAVVWSKTTFNQLETVGDRLSRYRLLKLVVAEYARFLNLTRVALQSRQALRNAVPSVLSPNDQDEYERLLDFLSKTLDVSSADPVVIIPTLRDLLGQLQTDLTQQGTVTADTKLSKTLLRRSFVQPMGQLSGQMETRMKRSVQVMSNVNSFVRNVHKNLADYAPRLTSVVAPAGSPVVLNESLARTAAALNGLVVSAPVVFVRTAYDKLLKPLYDSKVLPKPNQPVKVPLEGIATALNALLSLDVAGEISKALTAELKKFDTAQRGPNKQIPGVLSTYQALAQVQQPKILPPNAASAAIRYPDLVPSNTMPTEMVAAVLPMVNEMNILVKITEALEDWQPAGNVVLVAESLLVKLLDSVVEYQEYKFNAISGQAACDAVLAAYKTVLEQTMQLVGRVGQAVTTSLAENETFLGGLADSFITLSNNALDYYKAAQRLDNTINTPLAFFSKITELSRTQKERDDLQARQKALDKAVRDKEQQKVMECEQDLNNLKAGVLRWLRVEVVPQSANPTTQELVDAVEVMYNWLTDAFTSLPPSVRPPALGDDLLGNAIQSLVQESVQWQIDLGQDVADLSATVSQTFDLLQTTRAANRAKLRNIQRDMVALRKAETDAKAETERLRGQYAKCLNEARTLKQNLDDCRKDLLRCLEKKKDADDAQGAAQANEGDLRRQLAAAETAKGIAEGDLVVLQATLDRVQADEQACVAERDSLRQKVVALEGAVSSINGQLVAVSGELRAARQETESVRQSAQVEAQMKEREIKGLGDQLADSAETVDSLRGLLAAVRKQADLGDQALKMCADEVASLKIQQEATAAQNRALEQRVNQEVELKEELKTQLAMSARQTDNLDERGEILKSRLVALQERADECQREKERLERLLQESETRYQQANFQFADVNNSLMQARQDLANTALDEDRASRQSERLSQELAEVRRILADETQRSVDRERDLLGQLDAERLRCAALEDRLRTELGATQEQLTLAGSAPAEVDRLTAVETGLRQQLEAAQRELAAAATLRTRYDALQTQFASISERVARNQQELEENRALILNDNSAEDLARLQRESSALKELLERTRQEAEPLQRRLQEAQRALGSCRDVNELNSRTISQLQEQEAALRVELAAERRRANDFQVEGVEVRADRERLRAEIIRLTRELADATGAGGARPSALVDVDRMAALEEEAKEQRDQNNVLKGQIQNLLRQQTELQEELRRAEEDFRPGGVNLINGGDATRLAEARREIESLQRQLDSANLRLQREERRSVERVSGALVAGLQTLVNLRGGRPNNREVRTLVEQTLRPPGDDDAPPQGPLTRRASAEMRNSRPGPTRRRSSRQ